MQTVLSIDYSTTATGFAFFSEDDELLDYGLIKPDLKLCKGMAYPHQQLTKMKSLGERILNLIINLDPTYIVIEEIAGSRQRLGQKVLDGGHFILMYYIEDYINRVRYYDVTGKNGWRTHLEMRYSETDKLHNKEAKKLNKSLAPGQKLPPITHKTLACRYSNLNYNTDLDENKKKTDSDMADAIAMGSSFVRLTFPK